MSNKTNDELLERASNLLEEITNHPSGYETLLEKAIASNDLDEIYHLVTMIEGELARENFFNYDILVF